MLRAKQRSNKYQFYSVWFDPTRARGEYTLTITPLMRLLLKEKHSSIELKNSNTSMQDKIYCI
jgi:hypothetical protein